jgi:hypothetical protein
MKDKTIEINIQDFFAFIQGNVGMFDNSYFDNSFGFVLQFKNGLF